MILVIVTSKKGYVFVIISFGAIGIWSILGLLFITTDGFVRIIPQKQLHIYLSTEVASAMSHCYIANMDVLFCRQDVDDWNLAVWVYNGRNLSFYVNGLLVQEKLVTGKPLISPNRNVLTCFMQQKYANVCPSYAA